MAEKANFTELGTKELLKIKEEMKAKMKGMRVDRVTGSNFNLAEFKKAKKDVARINTILREYELGIRAMGEEK